MSDLLSDRHTSQVTHPKLGQLTDEDEWEAWGFLSAAERSRGCDSY
ncbi:MULTISPECIES: hypothetical protein [Trichocoleus]|uniref:Uncharacterized protein n=1 Tax=Trichocoleus desertorum GB2-A4 TaxID=2933944 RepID=A0ABV0JCQ0_9CYAN|nr:hypothetical protein [Trichocoleus sp. FACHB-46]MBD1864218.1 hypothetical protein [Trichocoleus sp. FACHB-46]